MFLKIILGVGFVYVITLFSPIFTLFFLPVPPRGLLCFLSPSFLKMVLTAGEKKGEKKKKKKKRVRFAEDVIDPTGDNEEFRRQKSSHARGNGVVESRKSSQNRGMPANRVALYNGILRDRVIHRSAYTY